MLTINMLGKGAIFYHQKCISDKLSSKLVALVCLLVLNKSRDMSREKIISYLWPDSDDEAAKSNLRFNLWNIRKAIPQSCEGEDFIITGKDYCRINEKYPYACDKAMLDGVKVSQLDQVEELLKLKELFKGDFLEGLYLRNCNEFNEMILFERVVCQNKQVEILEKLIGLYDEQEKYEEELQILNEVAAIEPYNEQFAFQAVQVYGKLGNRTAAINYYKNFEIVLRRNLNTSPNDELKQLYKELLESSCCIKTEQKHGDKFSGRTIELTADGLKDVEYFGAASLLDSLMSRAEKRYLLELDLAFLNDLSYIYSGFQTEYEKTSSDFNPDACVVPPVRIAFAFLKMMEHVSRRYELNIKICDLEQMDQASQNLISHLEKRKDDRIKIRYQ